MAEGEDRFRSNGSDLGKQDRLIGIGTALPDVIRSFEEGGTLGVLVIDASALAGIESIYGLEAQFEAMVSLGDLVQDLVARQLATHDQILAGEIGRSEIVICLFRDPADSRFYSNELPDLRSKLDRGLKKRGQRIGYPHLKSLPRLPLGMSAALRNPTIAAETQISVALEEARADADLNERVLARRKRQRLFEVIFEGRVRSVYEPIVDVSTRTVFGYEALVRGPEGTDLHSAAALFEAATRENLLYQLDSLCRKSGLDGARDFPSDCKLFLNIRPTTIHDPNFRSDALRRTLEKCALAPSDVVLEISEQESISNFEIFKEVRDYYGKLGFQIAMDDVGSGYSSLEAVVELCPEFIKVDRAFITGIDEDPARQNLLRAMRVLAEQIGARIIGEGLDTLEELETLGSLDIPFGQGWLFGKPHPLRTDT